MSQSNFKQGNLVSFLSFRRNVAKKVYSLIKFIILVFFNSSNDLKLEFSYILCFKGYLLIYLVVVDRHMMGLCWSCNLRLVVFYKIQFILVPFCLLR